LIDYGWYLPFALLGVLIIALAALPTFVRARFPRFYRGPIAALGAVLEEQRFPLRRRIAGLVTAFVAVVLLRWLLPDWFGGPGLSALPAAVFLLVVFMSFALWRSDSWSRRVRL
jgi:hypothetical protein